MDGMDPAQRVGERFTQLYYGLLAVRPSALRSFYAQDSQMSRSWCTFGSEVPKSGQIHKGPREIMDAIMASVGGQDPAMGSMAPVVVTNVETVQVTKLPDESGIMLHVTGCITYLHENQIRRFGQAVILDRSPMDKGKLCVRNDITHYLDAMGQMGHMAQTPMMGHMAQTPMMAAGHVPQPPTLAPQGPPVRPQQGGPGQQASAQAASSVASVAASAAAAASGAPPSAPAAIAGKASASGGGGAGPSVLPPAPSTAPVADAAPSAAPSAEASAGKSWASIASARTAKAAAAGSGAAPPSSPSPVPPMPASGDSAGSGSPGGGDAGPTAKLWVSNVPVEESPGGGQTKGGPAAKGHQVREALLECLRQHAPRLAGESIEVERKDEQKPFAVAVCSERTAKELVSLSRQRKVILRDKHLSLEVYHASGGRAQWNEDRGDRGSRGKGASGWQPRESRGGRGGWKGSR